jgi:hypothetical protein
VQHAYSSTVTIITGSMRRAARGARRPAVERVRVHPRDGVDHEARQVALLEPVVHADRHQEHVVAVPAHVRAHHLDPPVAAGSAGLGSAPASPPAPSPASRSGS